jgi:ApaG protein
MVFAITNGIKVSVVTTYEGRFFSKQGPLYVFSYHVTIANHSPDTVKLIGRHWYIYDTGEGPSEVAGSGVVGKQPVLGPGDSHTYKSGCHLRASIGVMKGHYEMLRLSTGENFNVEIPSLQFFASPRLN